MSGKKKEEGLKSALELAMERVRRGGAEPAKLSAAQKEAIAAIEGELKAGIAEVEIMTQQRLAEARASADEEKIMNLEAERADAISRLRRRAEKKKEKVHREGA